MGYALLLATALLLAAGSATAHPGRLAGDGCHVVRTNWTSADGKVSKKGARHCHRKLDEGLRLDGAEQLMNSDLSGLRQEPAPTKEPRR